VYKLYLIFLVTCISISGTFGQEQTKKITFDFYVNLTISQQIRNFIPTTNYKDIPPYQLEITERPAVFLSNYGFNINFAKTNRLTYNVGIALLKRGGWEKINTSLTLHVLIDSSFIYKRKTTLWYYNYLIVPIGITFVHAETSKWLRSLSASISISYSLDYYTISKGVFFNDSSFTFKNKEAINYPSFKDRFGYSLELGYRTKTRITNKTSFWFEPYINYLILNNKSIFAGHLNVGIYFGVQI